MERNFGYAVARAYAGHTGRSDAGTTSTYVRADVHEVAGALSVLTGEDHPLAPGSGLGRADRPTYRGSTASGCGSAVSAASAAATSSTLALM